MQIKSDDFQKVVEYIKGQLVNECGRYEMRALTDTAIMGKLDSLKLDDFLTATGETKERIKREPNPDDKGFAKLWAAYPPSPNFKYRGMVFKGSRVLRSNYLVCEGKYLKALSSHPDLTGDIIFKALEKQKRLAFEESYETGQNKLNHWNGFEVWLNQEKFMAFINMDDDEDVSSNSQEANSGTTNSSNFA